MCYIAFPERTKSLVLTFSCNGDSNFWSLQKTGGNRAYEGVEMEGYVSMDLPDSLLMLMGNANADYQGKKQKVK